MKVKGQGKIFSTAATITTKTSTPRVSIRNNTCDSASYNNDTFFDRKIGLITAGLQPCFASRLKELPQENALTIVNYILDEK